jgi:TRAP-type transport system periplasmic protein
MQRTIMAALFIALASTLSWVALAQTVELRLAHGSPRGHPNYTHAQMLAEQIGQATQGEIAIDVFGDRQLGDDRDIIQLVAAGTVDMGYASSVNFPLILGNVSFDALQLPGLVATYDDLALTLQSEAAVKMLDSLEDSGIKGLCYSEGGQRHFLNREGPIETIEDFAGLKTRIVPIPLHKAIWERAGTNPVGVPYAEVYTALQTNVIDAAESNISSIGADNLWENAKHVTLTGHYFWPGLFFMSKAKYDTLSPELQQVIVDTCRNLTPEFVAHTKQQEAEGIERLEAEGVQIYPFEDRERLLELMQPVFDEWAAKDPLIGEYIEATKKVGQ